MNSSIHRAVATALTALMTFTVHAHGDDTGPIEKPNPAAIIELDRARDATARFLDIDEALKEGYVDIGLFVPHMGWHYLKQAALDGYFDVEEPELLVYADDPCQAKRKLVAVEYAVPFEQSKRAPHGLPGRADVWDANQTFQLWTLHAWIWEYNPNGVLASHNPRVE